MKRDIIKVLIVWIFLKIDKFLFSCFDIIVLMFGIIPFQLLLFPSVFRKNLYLELLVNLLYETWDMLNKFG